MAADAPWRVLDTAPDATVVVDRGGVVVYANLAVGQYLGWAPGDLVGRSIDELLASDVRARHHGHVRRFVEDPHSRMMGAGLELTAVRRDGTTIPVEIALGPIGAGDDLVVVASIRDISERIRLGRQLSATTAQLAVVDERDRIARDLHDRVIQRLFGAGLHLQASLGRPDHADRVSHVIDEIDEAIKEIRTTIFTIHSPRGLSAGLESALLVALAEATRLLGHQPTLSVEGAGALVPDDLVVEVVDVVRELLTNVAKHAVAHRTAVDVEIGDGRLVVRVSDDGTGIDVVAAAATHGGHGLRNALDRAERRGGTCTVARRSPTGTLVTWSVPLD